jgi:hypothetical protein
MKNPNLENHRPVSVPLLQRSRSFGSTAGALFAAALSLLGGVASAGLVLEVKPAEYDTGTQQWPIATGAMAGDYFQGSSSAITIASKIHAGDGKGYNALDFTTAASIFGGPLCPPSLGGANPRTIEAWCFQPTNANGDAMTILCLSRQNAPTDGNFAFVNSLYNRSIWSNPRVVGWNASNADRSGKWVHLAVTYDGTTSRCYVNGVADKVDTYTYNTESGGSMTIGMMRHAPAPVTTPQSTANADGWNAWRGYLGSIRVYDEARTAGQIADDYALGVNYGETGQTLPKITSSAGAGGTINPLGVTNLAPGSNQAYTITPNLGYRILDVLVDDVSDAGAIASGTYTFTNVTTDHTIAATFEVLPPQTVSGKVTDGTNGILGATVYFKTSPDASVLPTFTTTTVDAAGNFSINLPPGSWYVTASEIHYFTPADATFTVASSPVTLSDIVLTANPNWDVVFSLNTDAFSAISDGSRITSWTCDIPIGGSMPALNTWNNGLPELGPVVETISGVKWEKNVRANYSEVPPPTVHTRQDGFRFGGDYAAPIPADGASVVTVVRPERKAISDPWTSIVDVFYQNLVLGIRNDNGNLVVWRNGARVDGPSIPDGQKTILSLVVQPTGQFKVFANGLEVMNHTGTSDMSALTPGSAGHQKRIYVGRGFDSWTVFNGNIADTSLFKVAISEARRISMETALGSKFGIALPIYHDITASAGTGGTISPSGVVPVTEGANQTFTITSNVGYSIQDVVVDGVPQGPTGTYTFTGVTAPHTISASFAVAPQYTVSGTVTDPTTGLPVSGATVNFSYTPNASISPYATATTDGSGAYSKTLYGGQLHVSVSKTGYHNTADQAFNLSGNLTGLDFGLFTTTRNTPQTGQLLFSVLTEALPNSGPTGNWPTDVPVGGSLTQLNNPTVAIVGNQKWEKNIKDSFQGYSVGTSSNPIPCTGASIVATVRPDRSSGDTDNWKSIVSYFHTAFGLCMQNGNGQVGVWRNGNLTWAQTPIPDLQKTVLSLVVQPTGEYVLYANGQSILSNATTSDMTSITPGPAGHEQAIFVGRGWDGWNCFNGNIGDVFVYKTALTPVERKQLEADSAAKFGITLPVLHTITATAGANGTISPGGAVEVVEGADQTFTFTPAQGYGVGVVTVDGVAQSGQPINYTFSNVTTAHTISVTFVEAVNDPFGNWIAFYFPAGGADAQKGADPDFDGSNNLLEYAFGTDPTDSATGPLVYTSGAGGSISKRGQPVIVPNSLNPPYFSAVFARRWSPSPTGLDYTVQFSADLQYWQDVVPPTGEQEPYDLEIEVVEVPFPATIDPGTGAVVPKFFRVLVTETP